MHKHAGLDLQTLGVRVGFKENIDSLYMKVAFQLFIPHTIPANDILRASHVPNALETIDNEAFQLIIYCF